MGDKASSAASNNDMRDIGMDDIEICDICVFYIKLLRQQCWCGGDGGRRTGRSLKAASDACMVSTFRGVCAIWSGIS